MSKKLNKITAGELIKSWSSLSEEYLNFVMKDRKVHLARVVGYSDKIFLVKTSKGHRLKLHLQDIDEVWQELKVSAE